MNCVICKTGEIKQASVRAEMNLDRNRLLVTVQADACIECGGPYYSADALRYLERLREAFVRKEIAPRVVGNVYEMP